ncbi:MAG: thioredoxin [Actinomycetota bacterium]
MTQETFEDTVLQEGITLVDFWAEWCGPCRMFGPIFEEASAENPDIRFGKVDTEVEQALAGALGISSIPTLMIFRDGILVFREPGALPKQSLDQLITAVKELDMDDVRRQLAAQEASQS